MTKHTAVYVQGSVLRHITALSLTSAVGLFSIFLVDLVDVFFISILGEPELAAAVGFAGVGLFLGAAITIGLSIAISTLVAQFLGADDEAAARRLAMHGLVYTLFWTIPVTLLMLWYAPELLSMLGAGGQTLDLAVGYFRIVGASLPVLGFGMAASSLLRAVGDARMSMWSTVLGGIINAIADPILIFGLGMGLTGAAIASVIARAMVAGVALYAIVYRHKLLSKPQWPLMWADIKQLNVIAIPSLITNLSAPLSAGFATFQMARFGTEAVAAASVIGRITPVAFAGLYGLSGAVGPVASQNVGAGEFHRVRQSLTASALFVVVYVIPVAVLLFLLQPWLANLFGLSEQAASLLRFYTNFIVISYLLFGLQLAANPLFTALRHPGLATLSNMIRDVVLAVPLIFVCAGWFGAEGVLAGQAIANAMAGILAFAGALWLTAQVERGGSLELMHGKHRWHFHRHVVPGVQHRGH